MLVNKIISKSIACTTVILSSLLLVPSGCKEKGAEDSGIQSSSRALPIFGRKLAQFRLPGHIIRLVRTQESINNWTSTIEDPVLRASVESGLRNILGTSETVVEKRACAKMSQDASLYDCEPLEGAMPEYLHQHYFMHQLAAKVAPGMMEGIMQMIAGTVQPIKAAESYEKLRKIHLIMGNLEKEEVCLILNQDKTPEQCLAELDDSQEIGHLKDYLSSIQFTSREAFIASIAKKDQNYGMATVGEDIRQDIQAIKNSLLKNQNTQ